MSIEVPHPVRWIESRWDRAAAAAFLGVLGFGPALFLPQGSPWGGPPFALAVLLAMTARDVLEPEPETEVEEARRLYREGSITLDELERRLGVLLDEDAQRVRETVESVPGVGPELSTAIARKYPTETALGMASREDLEDIPGVGPETSAGIVDRVDETERIGLEEVEGL